MTDSRIPRVERVERLARLMDRAVRIPGTRIRLGLDSIVGVVPGIGDTLTLLPAAFIVAEAHRMGVPTRMLARMVGNLGIDWAVGLIPLLGDLFDVGWKANIRNAQLLREHIHAFPEMETEKAAPIWTRPPEVTS